MAIESGYTIGYVVRAGEVTIHEGIPTISHEVPLSTTQSYQAHELIRMMPRLRNVRVGHCDLVLDGGRVIVEGKDEHGYFSFAIDNHQACEGWNLHVVDYAFARAERVRGRRR